MILKNNIFIIGAMASGKSTIGKLLSCKLNFNFIDSDEEIKKKLDMDINSIFKYNGEFFFRKEEEKILEEIVIKNNIVLSTGGGVIDSDKNINLLVNNGIIIYLKVSIENQLLRIKNNKDRPILSNNKLNNYNILYEKNKIRNNLYNKISNIIVDTNEFDINIIIEKILISLKEFNFFIKKFS
ncbi:shikimate kinase [endosymbiont of Sipalinus gigas]|uniref:shikimate kinase n=1 Tax=endosymbiont of Sipalinus gigas TaxID=1972134 RepID=UPI000DC70190|nr:shikimate kinase [endosymbiont of Sipalinus gigas]BBA85210.1 shikimate kinase [endosymbiont of Sipalinus gigas]